MNRELSKTEQEIEVAEKIKGLKSKFLKPDVNHQVREMGLAIIGSPLLKELPGDDFTDHLIDCITTANLIGGWKEKLTNDMTAMVTILKRDIRSKFSYLTKMELMNCFQMGAKGELCETVGLSVQSCLKWLQSYVTNTNRREAKSILLEQPVLPPKVLSREDRIRLANAAYQKFLKTGDYDDLGNIVYDFLDKGTLSVVATKTSGFIGENLIEYSIEEKKQIYKEAMNHEIFRLNKSKNSVNGHDTVKMIAAINSIGQETETPEAEKAKQLVAVVAKKIGLIKFFKTIEFDGATEIPFENIMEDSNGQ